MNIITTQKIIKIGTSKGVTLPARELDRLGLADGDQVRIVVEPIRDRSRIRKDYAKFKKQYGETLKNLADR